MDANELNPQPRRPLRIAAIDPDRCVPEFAIDYPPPPRVRRVWLPVFLFIATCVSTFVAGVLFSDHCPTALVVPDAHGGRRLSTG